MKRLFLAGCLLALCGIASAGESGFPAKLMRFFGLQGSAAQQGNRAYHRGDYERAAGKYAEAARDADPSSAQALAYNAGNAAFRLKRYDEAVEAYTRALEGRDASLAGKAHYNLGNAHFRKGEAALQSGREEGLSDYREALAHYKKALEINPSDPEAKRNVEVTQARIKELLDRQQQRQQQKPDSRKPPEPDEKAREALARAMHLAQQGRYVEAQGVLERVIAENATAASFKSHLQRIEDIIGILKGEKPPAPLRQDPRAQQGVI